MMMLKGLGRIERAALGGAIGSAANGLIHILARDGKVINPTFDSKRAGISLAVEGGVSVITGLTVSPEAGVISGLTALVLLGIDYAASRNLNAAPMPLPAPTTQKTDYVDMVKNIAADPVGAGKDLLKKIF